MSDPSDYLFLPHAHVTDLSERLNRIRLAIDQQAEDEALWVPAVTATEAYLQQELRKLHLIVEGK